ncbi:protein tyrosine phosphatase [Mucilaginibacter gracilis]|uniref:protein-tyrosine-phosphatase n=2 Tax=Mucilaginibacter gracilis TaxID=423350 RepID=A0A495IY40_9SPHI|nr:protein tyrosine phosphatase [Mucilaginibacter gracilis]
MVCLGNICRSPLAHGIMDNLVEQQGLGWQVDSAGTGDWHIGQGPDRRSVREAKLHGVDISKQICRQFSVTDFDEFDHIIVMDKNNKRDVLALARNNDDRKKVRLLLGDKDVPDPYHNDEQFAPVFKMVEQGCMVLMKELQAKLV